MAGVNKAILCGRLGKDPEVRDIGREGRQVCNLSLATSKKIKGEEKTEWHRITVWSEHSIKYLQDFAAKGSMVYIEGEIETRKYEKDGRDVYTTEIVVGQFGGNVQILTDFREREEKKPARERRKTYEEESRGGSSGDNTHDNTDLYDDEIPF